MPMDDDSDAFDTEYLDEIENHEEPIIDRSTPLLNRVDSGQLAHLLVEAARDESDDWKIFSEFVAEGPKHHQHHYFLLKAAPTSTHTPDCFLVRLGQRETVLRSEDHRVLTSTLADWTEDYGEEDVLWDPDGFASEDPPAYFREDHAEREPPDVVRRPHVDGGALQEYRRSDSFWGSAPRFHPLHASPPMNCATRLFALLFAVLLVGSIAPPAEAQDKPPEFVVDESEEALALDVKTGDVTGNGDKEIIVAYNDGKVSYYQGENSGYDEVVIEDGLGSISFVDPSDLDGDGDLDLVYTASEQGNVYWRENQTDGFSERKLISDNANQALVVYAEDMKNNGFKDIIYVSLGGGKISSLVWNENVMGDFSE